MKTLDECQIVCDIFIFEFILNTLQDNKKTIHKKKKEWFPALGICAH